MTATTTTTKTHCIPPDEAKAADRVTAIDRLLGEAKNESTSLRPMTTIGTETTTITMTEVGIAAPKKRSVEALLPRRKSEAASRRVVIILPHLEGTTV